ncbi:MAG TPA: porin [Candidatus Acidoferrum sp.]|nr:porin [Candidatus Acidoferrum sp.]
MRISSKCCFSLLLGSALAVSAFGQQANTDQQKTAGTQVVASTMDDLRERILLDRIEQLEKRLADLEGRTASAQPAPGQAAATTAPAAQEPAPATPPAKAPEAPAPPTWSAGPIDFSGRVSAYYTFNGNHPASMTNQLYNFNVKANQFSLDMAEFNMSHTADPVGFELDLGFGRAFDIIAGSEPQPSIFRNIRQAYASLKPTKAKGLEIDFGKFVTSDGAEVIETDANWNYSHSLLFAWAIPYYHFGLRATYPVNPHFTTGIMVANGWNNVEDNNSGKLVMFMETFTYKKFTLFENIHTGPENAGTNKGWRHLYDTTLLLTPTAKFNAYINFDYGHNQLPPGTLTVLGNQAAVWWGGAVALHFMPTSKWSFTPRVEYFKDRDGFAIGSGVPQDLKEGTFTAEYKMMEGLLGRVEYRRDWSNQPFFDRGLNLGVHKNQDTLSLGVLAFFGPKR